MSAQVIPGLTGVFFSDPPPQKKKKKKRAFFFGGGVLFFEIKSSIFGIGRYKNFGETRVLSARNPQLKILKYGYFGHFRPILETFFFKMRFSSKNAKK